MGIVATIGLVPTQREHTPEEEAAFLETQAQFREETKKSLSQRVAAIMENATNDLRQGIEAKVIKPPAGIFSMIASLSVQMSELAKIVPAEAYADEAIFLINNTEVLPDPLEGVRQLILKLLNNPNQPEEEDYPKPNS